MLEEFKVGESPKTKKDLIEKIREACEVQRNKDAPPEERLSAGYYILGVIGATRYRLWGNTLGDIFESETAKEVLEENPVEQD